MTDTALRQPTIGEPGPLLRLVRWLASDLRATLALAVLTLLLVVAATAPWLAPYSPTAQDVSNMLAAPSTQHLLGSDDLGRDIFSRLIYGAPATVYDHKLSGKLLGLPADHDCSFIMSFGYPADPSALTAPNRAGGRRSLDEVAREDHW